MYGEKPEDVIYYLTVYNEPMPQPAEPENVDVEGIVKGMYLLKEGSFEGVGGDARRAQLLASGVGVAWALEAQELLKRDFGVVADVWSVTSWNELRRDGLACDEQPVPRIRASEHRVPWVTQKLQGRPGPVIAVSDYMRQVQDQILNWVPGEFASLGADGFGFSDTRAAARRFFHIDGPVDRGPDAAAAGCRGPGRSDLAGAGCRAVPAARRDRRSVGFCRGRRLSGAL